MMENHFTHGLFERRSINKSRTHAPVKWFKEWVPQEVVATGGKCLVLKWVNEAMLKAIKEKSTRPYEVDPEPEPTTEVLFLCSYEGCGKTFIDAGALKKHSHVHGERQYVCQYENCGKKFLDSSKLKRHNLIHTGERHFVCTYEGCGKAFSLDFNLRSHMKTHSQENYHVCPYPECGKRYAHEYKLKNHVSAAHHDKNALDAPKYIVSVEKPVKVPEKPLKIPEKPLKTPEKPLKTLKSSTGGASRSAASVDRPFACPYEGCDKAYIHEYKLNLHLRREHPGHFPNENTKNVQRNNENDMDEGSDQEENGGKRGKVEKQNRAKPNLKLPPPKVSKRKSSTASPANLNVVKKPWPLKEEIYDEEDSEKTEEELDNVREGRRYGDNIDDDGDDDEETDYEE